MKKLKFYDLKKRKIFYSTKYIFKVKGKRKFAVTTAPSGIKSWRIVGKA